MRFVVAGVGVLFYCTTQHIKLVCTNQKFKSDYFRKLHIADKCIWIERVFDLKGIDLYIIGEPRFLTKKTAHFYCFCHSKSFFHTSQSWPHKQD